jgi:hypothetical protein
MKVNGREQDRTFLTYDELAAGASVDFAMTPVPDKSRATSAGARPYSLSRE